ncbi:hypothetical protein ACFB49_31600 [Sphingomonas sp. DBB INV C78]|uniref:DUF6491 family protein n=1 Tax=Sphingomonas sp. DBB INV C78 TaxID=3349434 RepID=UPI0036D27C0D
MTRHPHLTSLAMGVALVAASSGLSVVAHAQPAPATATKEASIPFVGSGSIRNYRAIDRRTLLVEDVHGKWYRAELMSDCLDLTYAQAIGFDVRGTNSFDKFSSIIVRGQNCPLRSLVPSEAPPKKAKKNSKG